MTPISQAVLIFRAVLALAAIGAGWLLWGQFTDWIKADEREAKEKAQAVAAGWQLTAENEQKAKEWLNKVATESLQLQAQKEAELKESRRALAELKRSNPEVQKWADTRIPDAMFGVRKPTEPTQPTAPTVVRDPSSRTPTSPRTPGREEGGYQRDAVGGEPVLPSSVGHREPKAEKAGDVSEVKPSFWQRIFNGAKELFR